MKNHKPPTLQLVRTMPHELAPTVVFETTVLGTTLRCGTNDARVSAVILRACAKWNAISLPHTGNVACLSTYWLPAGGYEATTGYVLPTAPAHGVLHHPAEGMLFVGRDGATVVFTCDELPKESILLGFALEAAIKRPPFYQIHASAVERNGRGVLIVAASGVGKSSLSSLLTLLHGCRYMGDDAILIDARDWSLVGMPWKVEIRPEILPVIEGVSGIIPEAAISWKQSRRGNERKMIIDASAVFGDRVAHQARLRAIVFLEKGSPFSWEPVSRAESKPLLRPIRLFGRGRKSVLGWPRTFAEIGTFAPFLRIRIDHRADPRENTARIAEIIAPLTS